MTFGAFSFGSRYQRDSESGAGRTKGKAQQINLSEVRSVFRVRDCSKSAPSALQGSRGSGMSVRGEVPSLTVIQSGLAELTPDTR